MVSPTALHKEKRPPYPVPHGEYILRGNAELIYLLEVGRNRYEVLSNISLFGMLEEPLFSL